MQQRTLGPILERVSRHFPVILVTGPRQVGKTTLLEGITSARGYRSVSLDDLGQRSLAQEDPLLFLQTYPPPVMIDEVQYAPQLFSAIKSVVDREKKNGLFWLTGSQKFHLMQGVSESLAGRVAVLDLLGFSQAELQGNGLRAQPFLPTPPWLEEKRSCAFAAMDVQALYRRIWRGSFPRMALEDETPRDVFYSSYVQTYIQRDVRALSRVGDELRFARFLRATAARTAQLVNYADLARDVDIDMKTAKAWLSILETSGLVFLLQPYHTNVTKRLVKTPKLYFLDTGLCAYLTQWSTPATLEAGAMSGAILETWMLGEILKSFWHCGLVAPISYYRDRDQHEIDILLEQDGVLYPIECKKSANPTLTMAKSFSLLEKAGHSIGMGIILCLRETALPLSASVTAIPVTYL